MEALIPGEDGAMSAPRKYPQELRDRAVRMVFEIRQQTAGQPGAIVRVANQAHHVRHALPLREDVVARRCGLVRREAVLTSSLYLIEHLDADPLQRAQLASRLGVVDDAVIGIQPLRDSPMPGTAPLPVASLRQPSRQRAPVRYGVRSRLGPQSARFGS